MDVQKEKNSNLQNIAREKTGNAKTSLLRARTQMIYF